MPTGFSINAMCFSLFKKVTNFSFFVICYVKLHLGQRKNRALNLYCTAVWHIVLLEYIMAHYFLAKSWEQLINVFIIKIPF